jgi:hypothetical protein
MSLLNPPSQLDDLVQLNEGLFLFVEALEQFCQSQSGVYVLLVETDSSVEEVFRLANEVQS